MPGSIRYSIWRRWPPRVIWSSGCGYLRPVVTLRSVLTLRTVLSLCAAAAADASGSVLATVTSTPAAASGRSTGPRDAMVVVVHRSPPTCAMSVTFEASVPAIGGAVPGVAGLRCSVLESPGRMGGRRCAAMTWHFWQFWPLRRVLTLTGASGGRGGHMRRFLAFRAVGGSAACSGHDRAFRPPHGTGLSRRSHPCHRGRLWRLRSGV
jgi:hypothetical protein